MAKDLPQNCSNKPVEAYFFIDPLCRDCWVIEPLIIKLLLEYGKYFSIRHVLTGKAEAAAAAPGHKWNKPANVRFVWEKSSSMHGMSCDGRMHMHACDASPHIASLAIKAAELQGRRAGSQFLRKLQEHLFLQNVSRPTHETLLACAEKSGIDLDEFLQDLQSVSAAKAFQCDLKFTNELHITEIPSIVFFNAKSDEEGVKISGMYSYDVYVQVLREMVKENLVPEPLPPLEALLQCFEFISTNELAIIYDMSEADVMREMKKLLLKRKVVQVPTERDMYWKFV
ncbi:ClpXP adapter SpxH family protein [Ectobacillus ponti]|uniref:ClpXP adapter protein SpxH n=1 Tax=Ectobacillus ponti TaxID=2961894 RepID=A0AA41X8M0_9BACI|nr:ClpXP adapter SpxH family protein [Ectobacillus ponti]MCP8968318.1 DsbA family protein [Ectobacillus ponti]